MLLKLKNVFTIPSKYISIDIHVLVNDKVKYKKDFIENILYFQFRTKS